MQTAFSLAQLADPAIAEADGILRNCVHCGFCTATCPTYVLLGDELDSPRGRIYLIKDLLEQDRAPTSEEVVHIDRCLSCLSCMTTCPSGVNYMHLVDQARAHVAETYERPVSDRLMRRLLAAVLPRPGLFRAAVRAAALGRPFRKLMPKVLRALLDAAPVRLPVKRDTATATKAEGPRRKRVALLAGCVQQVLAPQINEATVRLLARHGCDIVVPPDAGCCGALVHHLGEEDKALHAARRNVDTWTAVLEDGGLDAIVINASGCGTMVKDYGFMLRLDPTYAAKAARISALARDISEVMADLGLKPQARHDVTVAYHAACSLQHGQKIVNQPKALLAAAGYRVHDVPEGHLCCGSAGTYSLLQPDIATALRDRKVANIQSLRPDVVAAGNIGCMEQLAGGTGIPVVHVAELLDWATGGPKPGRLNA